MDIKKGQRYRHYKGKEYTILALGQHSETGEKLVVYRAEYDDPKCGKRAVWIRPYALFAGTVTVNGKVMQRFTLLL